MKALLIPKGVTKHRLKTIFLVSSTIYFSSVSQFHYGGCLLPSFAIVAGILFCAK